MPTFSTRTQDLVASPVREILAVIDRPGMISFAGGLPASATFPTFVLDAVPTTALQYGPSEGEPALRARIADEVSARGLKCNAEQVLVLSGSQQGIDLVAKLMIDQGTPVAVEAPTYLAALQVFRFFGAALQTYDMDAPGAALRRGPALLYTNPTFQNPTGLCYSRAQRSALAWACDSAQTVLFEDDPYRDLAYEPCDRTPICARLARASWVYQSSFSKSLAPGLRLGYLVASHDLMPMLIRLKQAADLHSSRLSQWLVQRALDDPARASRLDKLVRFYRERRDLFQQSLQRHFADIATWEAPAGGLFFWLKLRGVRLNTAELLRAALEQNVAFMPGEPFFATPEPASYLRLNFSHSEPETAARGLEILARLIRASRDVDVERADGEQTSEQLLA